MTSLPSMIEKKQNKQKQKMELSAVPSGRMCYPVLMQASGVCNFTLRHSQLLLIHLLMPSDLPAGHRRRGLQSNREMEGEKEREADVGMGSLVYLAN